MRSSSYESMDDAMKADYISDMMAASKKQLDAQYKEMLGALD